MMISDPLNNIARGDEGHTQIFLLPKILDKLQSHLFVICN